MLFSSVEFLFYFLPIFLIVYYLIPARNAFLLFASIVFYAWGEMRYLYVLFAYILINYCFGLLVSRSVANQHWWVRLGVLANLALLIYFKYLGFITDQLNAILPHIGWQAIAVPSIALPLGISFFAFQGISYLIDVQRGDAQAQRSLLKFAMYKAMFPQLVAGPIVRYRQIAHQIDARRITLYRIRIGICYFLGGLAQKVLIANTVAIPAEELFQLPAHDLTIATAWFGAICYSVQIFFDFAGYSNMAIGLGHFMGFTLPPNFNRPYVSLSVTEFWRRWHISLSTWFRDYLYIPLGGNQRGAIRTYLNLATVFVLCGFWHGASWNFAIWGALHGFFLVVERAGLGTILDGLWRPVRHAYTLLVVCFGWVLFRADSLDHAIHFMGTMVGAGESVSLTNPLGRYLTPSTCAALVAAVLICAVHWPSERQLQYAARKLVGGFRPLTIDSAISIGFSSVALSLGLLSAFSLATGTYNPFIYFRF
jgi:alginate O-acetyltransferase complex protein AlgI